MSQDVVPESAGVHPAAFRPYEDARAIVRLFQCAECSYPLRDPVTLPCGNSICKPCMPSSHVRTNITYPQNADRAEGFRCPFEDCAAEHPLADCSLDVALNKMVGIVKSQIGLLATNNADGLPLHLHEKLDMRSVADSNIDIMPRSKVVNAGRIVSAFVMASAGELNYRSDLTFTPVGADADEVIRALDVAVTDTLRDLLRAESECQVCYGVLVDPVTTQCGHTFCRKCVARVIDHSTLCPACRRPMNMRPGVLVERTNSKTYNIIKALLAEDLAARLLILQEDESNDENWIPLFPCTLAYPGMPTFLHIFEPRYRLMVRRCLENGSRKFGMMMYNGRGVTQEGLGRSQFMQYGTMLYISRLEVFNDGRSLLETQGLYRFKVLEGSILDGYHIGRVQRIDDMPLADEEAAEALETRGPEPDAEDRDAVIKHMSTQALLQHAQNFISAARARSADWLHERVLAAYGQPPVDPALFPFWFASVIPIHDEAKYQLLPLTSVRERLKLIVKWIMVLEESRCPGQRIVRVARPVEPESVPEPTEDGAAQAPVIAPAPAMPQSTTSTETSHEPQAPATIELGAETEELYQAEDPRDDAEHNEPLASQR